MSILLFCNTLIVLLCTTVKAQSLDIVDLVYARYQGVQNTTLGLITYYGIPYAQAPVGDLRWQPPQPIDATSAPHDTSVINATVPGAQCPQFIPYWYTYSLVGSLDFSAGVTPSSTSEDCLHLDVIVPAQPQSTNLPVVVQIHGGGYTVGSSLTFDGSQFTTAASGSLIYVQIQYRLGPYGFLSSKDIKQNGTANAGLLDQRAALDWIRRHILAFGGDPEKITIWGGSAGGGSVTNQLILNGGDPDPPFQAAIAEFPWWQPFHDDSVLQAQYELLLSTTGCTNLSCLRHLDSETLTNASQKVFEAGYLSDQYGVGDFYFGPSVDGVVIKDLPSNEFKQGHFANVSLLTDHDAYEGVIFTNLSLSTLSDVQSDLTALWPNAANSPTFFTRLFQLYPSSFFSSSYFSDPIQSNYSALAAMTASSASIANNTAFYQRQTIFADAFVNCPTYYVASAFTNAGLPVWKLRFAAGLETHGATISYLLYPDAIQPTQNDAMYAGYMKDYFRSFIVYGDPNIGGSIAGKPEWPEWYGAGNVEEGTFNVLGFNQTNVGVDADSDVSARCDLLHGQSYLIRN